MPLSLVVNTAPAAEPLTTAEAKAQSRVTASAEDALIARYITAAREHVEAYTGRALIDQTWNWKLDVFSPVLLAPRPPLQSVTQITYVDSDGITQTLASSVYRVDNAAKPGRITEAWGQVWPTIRPVTAAVEVRFVAGYGAAGSDVPEPIRHAMGLLVDEWFDNRAAIIVGTIVADLPFGVRALLDPYRVPRWS